MTDYLELRRMRAAGAANDLEPADADDLFAPEYTQTTHGFVVGDVVYRSSATDHAKAIATARSTLACGIVIDQPDANTFSAFCGSGKQINIPSHGLGAFGAELWLSQGSAGTMTTTEPSAGWYQYVGFVIDANNIFWEPHKLGVELL
jgi:hypothetical protein